MSTEDIHEEWQPIESAPWKTVVWVKNHLMENPVKATRGYHTDTGVHPDTSFFTTVYTPHRFFPTPPGRLCCPTHWKPVSEDNQ